VVEHQGKLYVFGGYDSVASKSECFDTLWEFDVASARWARMGRKGRWPRARCGHAAVVAHDAMYILGGTGADFGKCTFGDMWRFDFALGEFAPVAPLRADAVDAQVPFGSPSQQQPGLHPPAMYGQAMVHVGAHVLVFGGTDGHAYSNDLFALNLDSLVWTRLACSGDVPSQRYMAACFVCAAARRPRLVVIGGGKHMPSGQEPIDVYVLDLASLAWTRLPLPNDESTPRLLLGSAVLRLSGDDFMLFGGRSHSTGAPASSPSTRQSSSTWLFSLSRGRWTRCGGGGGGGGVDDVRGRDYLQGAVVGDRAFLFGGFDGACRLNQVLTRRLSFAPASLEMIALQQLCKALNCDDADDADDAEASAAELPETVRAAIAATACIAARPAVTTAIES